MGWIYLFLYPFVVVIFVASLVALMIAAAKPIDNVLKKIGLNGKF